jgi:hypothetical protein
MVDRRRRTGAQADTQVAEKHLLQATPARVANMPTSEVISISTTTRGLVSSR